MASTLIFLVTLVLAALTALFILMAPVLMPLFAPGFDGTCTDLTVTLSQILFPIVLMLGITGMVVGMLNSFDRFGASRSRRSSGTWRSSPTLVVLTPAFHGDDRIYAYAIGVLVGTAIQLAIPRLGPAPHAVPAGAVVRLARRARCDAC